MVGARYAERVQAMRSMLNGPRVSHTPWNAVGTNCITMFRDGREMASVTPLVDVLIHLRERRMRRSCVTRFLERLRMNAATADLLSPSIETCARRKASGRAWQN